MPICSLWPPLAAVAMTSVAPWCKGVRLLCANMVQINLTPLHQIGRAGLTVAHGVVV